MSILRSIIDSIKASVSNEAFEEIKKREYHDQIIQTIEKANEDGNITADEIVEITELVSLLDIEESEMGHLKLQIMKKLIEHILLDNKVTEAEMQLLLEVEDGLHFAVEEKTPLETNLAKVKAMYQA